MRAFMLFGLACLVFSPQITVARDHGEHGRKHWKGDDEDRERHRRYADDCFRDDNLRVIRDYYHQRELPPGLAKKYYRTGQLPPGWQKRIRPFPYEVEETLPPVCAGCARGYVDGYAVVYRPQTQAVIDLHFVFGN